MSYGVNIKVGKNCFIGKQVILSDNVKIGDGNIIDSHSLVVLENVTIGDNNVINLQYPNLHTINIGSNNLIYASLFSNKVSIKSNNKIFWSKLETDTKIKSFNSLFKVNLPRNIIIGNNNTLLFSQIINHLKKNRIGYIISDNNTIINIHSRKQFISSDNVKLINEVGNAPFYKEGFISEFY